MIPILRLQRTVSKSYPVRHAISISLAVLIASVLHFTISFSHEGWIVLAAFLVSQTTRGTPLRQGLIYLVLTVIALTAGSYMGAMNNSLMINLALSAIFLMSGMIVFIRRPLANSRLYFLLLFMLVYFVTVMMMPVSLIEYQYRLFDTVIGSVIAIIINCLVLPVRLGAEFAEGVVPAFKAFDGYLKTLVEVVIGCEHKRRLADRILEIEDVLQRQSGAYPEWVYEVGFNRGLRAGFRFFLLSIERIADNLLSLNFLLSRLQDYSLLDSVSTELTNVMLHNQQLLSIIISYFETKTLPSHVADFTSDIAALENTVQQMLPPHLEFLEMSQSYIVLTAIMRDVRDLRQLLLSLVMALPAEAAQTMRRN